MKKYTVKKFPKIRKLSVDILNRAVLHHTISGFTEYDITKPREIMNKLKQEKNKKISFLAFFATCLAKALNENKIIQGMKIGNRKVVIFEEIDICTIIESEENWQKVPLMYIVRDAGNKNLININHELQDVKSNLNTFYNNFESKISKYLFLPQFLRKIILKWKYHRDPIFRKKLGGTVCLTSIGIMFGNGSCWGLPLSLYPLYITIGSIVKKPTVKNDEVCVGEFVNITISFDHDIVDGAPGARFTGRLKELVESGYGLANI